MFHTEHREAVAAEIRALMGRKKISAKQLAKSSEISEAALSRKLNGHVGFTVDELIRVARALDVSPVELMEPAA